VIPVPLGFLQDIASTDSRVVIPVSLGFLQDIGSTDSRADWDSAADTGKRGTAWMDSPAVKLPASPEFLEDIALMGSRAVRILACYTDQYLDIASMDRQAAEGSPMGYTQETPEDLKDTRADRDRMDSDSLAEHIRLVEGSC
jgi:hypothetical protein